MSVVIDVLLCCLTVILSIPTAVLCAEVLVATICRQGTSTFKSIRPPVAVLMPAHNEADGINIAIQSILAQLREGDRLLVVADNCTDATAAVAAAAGAEVITRTDASKRGKGYALDCGMRSLEHDRPEVVVVADADCLASPGAIDELAKCCAQSARPVQALYLMHSPPNAPINTRIAEFAWLVKNYVRPLGLHKLGLPCQLMGSGMAFPWSCLRDIELATGHIVEDLKLGIDLTALGKAPVFCPGALVSSSFPASSAGIEGQRTRWEHGYLGVIFSEVPRLLRLAIATPRADQIAILLDLSVPPIALLSLLVGAAWILSLGLFLLSGATVPLWVASFDAFLLLCGLASAWVAFARHIVPLRSIALAPLYVLWKIPLYIKFVVARQTQWVRSKRDL